MKNKLIVMGIIILLIITSTITIFAATENTIILKEAENKTEVKAGENFSIVFYASCVKPIAAVEGFSYTYDTEKLEVVNKSKPEDFTLVEEEGQTSLVFFGETPVNQAEIYTITFKVKDGVKSGNTAVVTLGQTKLYDEDSEYTVPEQNISIKIVEDAKGDDGTGDDGTGDEPCEHIYSTYKNSGDGTHTTECTICKEKHTEKHTYGDYIGKIDGTHTALCTKCSATNTEECKFENGKCSVCGSAQPDAQCNNHTYGEYKDNGDGTHSAECTICKEKVTKEHTYENKVCTACKAKHSTEDCKHENGSVSVKDNKDGTHSSVCEVCGEKVSTEKHSYKDGVCIGCGVKQPSTGGNNDGSADGKYPNAGIDIILIVSIFVIIALAVVIYRKNQKYRDIK